MLIISRYSRSEYLRTTVRSNGRSDLMAFFVRVLSVTAVGLAAAAGLAAYTGALDQFFGERIDLEGAELVFEDNFDALDVSAWGPGTRWIAHTPWNGDFGDAKFVDPREGFPFTVQDGVLSIEARRDEAGKWESGLLASADPKGDGFSLLYGYFEMRARFPEGAGTWPAFWLIDRNEARTIEVDAVEHYGHEPARYSASLHVWDRQVPENSRSATGHVPVSESSLYSGFHTYGVAVGPMTIDYYFNGRKVWSQPTPVELGDGSFYMLVDLGLGAGWPIEDAPDPSVMEVDYVKAWRLAGE
ncbi:conserved hypothetical protein [Aurantimonas manganoxydans SI85-9A1]|uniref:GH16 domain-containing protein n=2 Tax=Aurantimonas manganoxydans TaxID=651183 RepID=Q1YMT5_AURMS|nr:conserved hypothetical protein [Aurantimonas manganoxydans SI85-9A1]